MFAAVIALKAYSVTHKRDQFRRHFTISTSSCHSNCSAQATMEMFEAGKPRVVEPGVPTWYNLPWSEKIVMCLSKPALPVEGYAVSHVVTDYGRTLRLGFS